jgi:hypothetical protein
MPKVEKARIGRPTQSNLYFPRREQVGSDREYDEKVAQYWDAMDVYHAMAVDLHDKLMDTRAVAAKNGAKK